MDGLTNIVRGIDLVKHIDKTHYDSHREAWLLLPWYANGSVESKDKRLVEGHLKVCLPCRSELLNQRMLLGKVCETTAFEIAGRASFSRLKNRIHTDSGELTLQKRLPAWLYDFPKWIIRRFAENCTQHPTAFAFSVLLLVLIPVLFPVYFQIDKLQKPEFRTLANSTILPASQNDIRVVFSSELMRKQMDEILAPINGQIVEGPSANNVFRVRIENPQNGLVAVISMLRTNTGVVFAEPLVPPPPVTDQGIKK